MVNVPHIDGTNITIDPRSITTGLLSPYTNRRNDPHTNRRNDPLSNPFMAGLDPAILTRTHLAKNAIPISKHPIEMAWSSLAMTGLAARAVRQYQWRLVVRRETGKE